MQSVTWIARKLKRDSESVESTFYSDTESIGSTNSDVGSPSVQAGQRNSSKFYVSLTENSDVGYTENSNGCTQNEIRDDKINRENSGANDARKSNCSTKSSTGSISSSSPSVSGKRPALKPKPKINFKFRSTSTASTEKTPSINSNGDVTPSESVSAKVNTKSSWFAKDKKPMASTSGNISKPSSINKKNEGSIKIPADSPKTNKPHIPIKPVTKYSKKLPSLSSDIPVNASSDASETKCGEINHSGSTTSPEVSSVTDGTHASDNTTKLTNCSNSDLLKVDNKNISTKDANPDEGVLRTENNIDKKLSNSNLVSENKTVTNIINKSSKFEQSQNKFTSNTTEPKIVQKTNFNNKNVADSTSLVAGIRNTLFPTNSESINSSNNPSSSLARPIPSWKRSGEVKPLTDTVGAKSGVSSIAGSSSLTCLNVDSSNIKSSTTSKSCSNLSDEPDKIKSESIPPEKNNNSSKNAENKSENTEKADSSSGPVGKILHKENKIIIHQEYISNNDSGTSNQIDPPSTNTGASCKAGNTNTAVGRLKQRLAPGKPVGHNRRSFTTEDTDIFRGKVPCLPPTLPKKPSPLVLRKELNDKESSEQKQKESDENFRRRLSKGRSQSLSNSDVPAALLGGHAPTPKPSPPAKPKYLKNTTNDGVESAEVSSASSLSIESIPADDVSGSKTVTTKSTLLARVSVTNDKDSVNKIKRELWKGHKAKQLDRFNSVGSYSDMSSTGRGGQLVDNSRGYSVAMKPSDNIYVSIGEEGNAGGGDHAYETMDFDKDPSFPEGESNPGSPDDCDLRRKYSESIASDEEDLDEHCSFSENSSEEEEEVEGAEVAHHGHHHSKNSKKGKNSPEVEMSKERKVAEELLKTERQYVEVLHLIDQVFRVPLTNKNREERFMPDGVIPWMFSCIGSIYLFHKDFLLPQLEQCMTNWESGGGRIGQVMKKLAPGLLLYTDYVKNFDNANNLIIAWRSKSQKFSSVLDEIQSRKECGHLSLQNHMLGPIQRIPRYKLLLERYIECLKEETEEKSDAEQALVLVSKAADHSNEAMRKIEKFRKLLEISDMLGLGGADSIVSPTRELIREGSVIKISARDGTRIERYLFLFNDILLVCQSSLKIGSKQQYIVKSKLDIEGMRVMYGNNPATPNTFCVRSKQKAIEFHSSSSEENDDWQKTIWKAIAELTKKITNYKENLMADNELGTRAPAWIRDQETSMCMTCGVTFTTFRRRHHCRACGQVVCSDCSKQKFALAFDNHKENRVCYICFKKLNNEKMKSETSKLKTEAENEISLTYKTKTPSLLRVKATDTAVISGYLMMSYDCKTWSKRFIAAHNSFALYIFKAHKDMKAKSSIPLPGYQVELIKDSLSSDQSSQYIVKIFHHQSQAKTIYFQTDDTQKINRWHVVLKAFVKAELPELEGSVSTPALTPVGITDLEHPLDDSVYEEYEPGTPLNSPSVRTPGDKPTNVTKPH